MRRLFIALPLLILPFFQQAHGTGDSINYLLPNDTIFLRMDDFGNKLFMHTLEKGQTLFSLAKFYGLKLALLTSINDQIDVEAGVAPGTQVKVPIPDSAILKTYEGGFHKAGFAPVMYVVKGGDSFYRIAKHYFNLPMDSLKRWNALSSTMMYAGMKLHVGYMNLEGIPETLQPEKFDLIGSKMDFLQNQFEAQKSKSKPIFQNGAAYWLQEKKGRAEYYCLHRTARPGTVVQIKNPMKYKVAYAEVLGPIPDRAYGNEVIIVLSPTVANALGAKDPKFYVELKYIE